MSSASKHKKKAIGHGMHGIKAQFPLGSLGVSEVTQLSVLPLEGFILRYCLPLVRV